MDNHVPSSIPTPDFRRYAMEPAVIAASLEDNWVRVSWADGKKGRFHNTWLRDNAADERSIDPHARERTYDFLEIPFEIAPTKVGVSSEGALAVEWDRDVALHPM